LTDDTSIIKLAEEVKARTGGVLDVLINNVRNSSVVGMFLTHCLGTMLSRAPLLTTPIASVRHDYEINVYATIRLTQLLAPLLIHTAARRDPGRTVKFNVERQGVDQTSLI